MKKRVVKKSWKVVRSELKKRFNVLSDDDLRWVKGREEELIHRIRQLTGETKEAVVFAMAAALDACAFARDGLLKNAKAGFGARLAMEL
jgi:uncharacterized protein YjbJ (UPF0337 family)